MRFWVLIGLTFLKILNICSADNAGSGFLISDDGYVVTCDHVIQGVDNIFVKLGDKEFKAKEIIKDANNDIAIIKIEGTFKGLKFCDTGNPKMGDQVFTIGFPNPEIQGYMPKISSGIINSLTGLQDDPTTFQISVPIQPGNSGGPLLNEKNEIIGIVNSKIDSQKTELKTGYKPENVNFAKKVQYLKLLLKNLDIENTKTKNNQLTKDNLYDSVVFIRASRDLNKTQKNLCFLTESFRSGKTKKFSTKDNPKACGLNMTFSIPQEWDYKDGDHAAVIANFGSPDYPIMLTLTIVDSKPELLSKIKDEYPRKNEDELIKILKEREKTSGYLEDMNYKSLELMQSALTGSSFKYLRSLTIDNVPAFEQIITAKMEVPNGSVDMQSLLYTIWYDFKIVYLMFAIDKQQILSNDQLTIDETFGEACKLARLITSTLIIQNQWDVLKK